MNIKNFILGFSTLVVFSLQGTPLVVNGDFETGDFTGWTTASQTAAGSWVVYSGTKAPISGNTISPHPQGLYAAVADQNNIASMILYQNIQLPPGKRYLLSFEYFYTNFAKFHSPTTLSCKQTPNQQARVDILSSTVSDPYSVAKSDVLANVFNTDADDPNVYGPTTLVYDLTPFAGQTIRLRYACVNTEYFFNVGVDNIRIDALGPLNPPTNLQGYVITNAYFNDPIYSHFILWTPSTTVDTLLGYRVYSNDKIVSTIPPQGPYEYENLNCTPNVAVTYKVSAYDAIGESVPVTITLR